MDLKPRLFFSLSGIIAGILSVYFVSLPLSLILCLLLFPFTKLNKKLLFFLSLLLMGSLLTYRQTYTPAHHIKNFNPSDTAAIKGTIAEIQDSAFSMKIAVNIQEISFKNGLTMPAAGGAMLQTQRIRGLRKGSLIEAATPVLRKVPPPKNPAETDYSRILARRGLFWEGKVSGITELHPGPVAMRIMDGIRERYEQRLSKHLKYFPEEEALLSTITMGSESIPFFIREAGRRSGTYHLLVISGLHLAFVYLLLKVIFIPFSRLNNTHPKVFPSILLFCLWMYAFFTGLRTPVLRATLMFSVFAFAELFERPVDALDSVIITAIILLLVHPLNLFTLSFQLTFIVTAGLLLFVKRFGKIAKQNYFYGIIFCSTAAQISAMPILAYYFNEVYFIGFLSNIVFVPLTGVIVILSFLSLFFWPVYIPLRFLLTGFLRGITLVAQISPKTDIFLSLPLLLLIYLTLFFFLSHKQSKKSTLYFSAGALLAALLSSFWINNIRPAGDNKLYFLSLREPSLIYVNKKDAVLFLPDHYKGGETEDTILPVLRQHRVSRISDIFFTSVSYNSLGTLKRLSQQKRISNVHHGNNISNGFSSTLLSDFFAENRKITHKELKRRRPAHASGMEIEYIGIDGGRKSYIIIHNNNKILVAPYVGKEIAEIIRDEHFDVIYILNYRNLKDVREALTGISCDYIILPDKFRRFDFLENNATPLYLNKGAVRIIFNGGRVEVAYCYD